MQEYKDDRIIKSLTGDTKELIGTLEKDIKNGKATHGIIGKLPQKGDLIKINGLKYRIVYVDKQLGKVNLKII